MASAISRGSLKAESPVTFEYSKWDGAGHYRFQTHLLGEDAWGTWLRIERGYAHSHPDGRAGRFPAARTLLVPHDRWWVATYRHEPALHGGCELYIDIATPAVHAGDRITSIDLDLDVLRFTDGRVELADEDEFEDHQRALAYPEEVVRTAAEVARELMVAVGTREEPFGDHAGRNWGVPLG